MSFINNRLAHKPQKGFDSARGPSLSSRLMWPIRVSKISRAVEKILWFLIEFRFVVYRILSHLGHKSRIQMENIFLLSSQIDLYSTLKP